MTTKYWTDGKGIWRKVTVFVNIETQDEVPEASAKGQTFSPVLLKQEKKKQRVISKPRSSKKTTSKKYIHSDYKGVRGNVNGRWEALYYNRTKKRSIYLGTFNDELTAAIQVQKELGNRDEVLRLQQLKLNQRKVADSPQVQTGMNPGDYKG